jgi:hypothetical protein
MRRVRVFVTLNPATYGAFAMAVAGYSSSEAIFNLRALEGSRRIASDLAASGEPWWTNRRSSVSGDAPSLCVVG